jgi:hypothetical protein
MANLAAVVLLAAGLLSMTATGVAASAWALGFLLSMVALRALLMLTSAALRMSARDLPKALAVAAAYEAGRALALAGRFGHRRRRTAALA